MVSVVVTNMVIVFLRSSIPVARSLLFGEDEWSGVRKSAFWLKNR